LPEAMKLKSEPFEGARRGFEVFEIDTNKPPVIKDVLVSVGYSVHSIGGVYRLGRRAWPGVEARLFGQGVESAVMITRSPVSVLLDFGFELIPPVL